MKEDLLEKWGAEMKLLVWRNGLIGRPPYSEIDKIKENLTYFFGNKVFEYDSSLIHTDQFYALFTSKKISSLFKLAEISNTISFYRQQQNFNLYDLHGQRRRLSYDEIQGKLFELYINKIFIDNNLDSRINEAYFDSNNNEHTIDIILNFNNVTYLVECYKVRNRIKEYFSKLIFEINKFTNKFSHGFKVEEMFSGYIVFKTEPITPTIIHNAAIVFKNSLSKFISKLRDHNSRKFNPTILVTNSDIDFVLFSNHLPLAYELEKTFHSAKNSLTFKTNLHGKPYGNVTFDFSVNYVYRNYLNQILEKLQHKKHQHKDAPFKNKIIVAEFENIPDNKIYQGSLPVTKADIERLNLDSIVDQETSFLFWIKTIESTRYTTNIGIATYLGTNLDLKAKLHTLKINWC